MCLEVQNLRFSDFLVKIMTMENINKSNQNPQCHFFINELLRLFSPVHGDEGFTLTSCYVGIGMRPSLGHETVTVVVVSFNN